MTRSQLHANLVMAALKWADSSKPHGSFGDTNRQLKRGFVRVESGGTHLGIFLVALVADIAILLTQVLHLHSAPQAAAMTADATWLTQQS